MAFLESSAFGVGFETGEFSTIIEAGPTEASKSGDPSVKPWYEKLEFGGFLAAGVFSTGADRPESATTPMLIQELLLQARAYPGDNTEVYFEIYPLGWPTVYSNTFNVGEAFLAFKNVAVDSHGRAILNFKLGRFNLPFGDEYLWQNYWFNPLITRGAAWWWGWDQGLMAYGNLGQAAYVATLTNGGAQNGLDDNGNKAFNAKIYGDVLPSLSLSVSYAYSGLSSRSSLWQGWRRLAPTSPAILSSAQLFEIEATYSWRTWLRLNAEAGGAWVDNLSPGLSVSSSAQLKYCLLESMVNLTSEFYLAARYSAIGTFADDSTYPLNDGMGTTIGSNTVIDASDFKRWAVGAGYRLNFSSVLKLEYSQDHFNNATGSSVGTNRSFVGFQAVTKF